MCIQVTYKYLLCLFYTFHKKTVIFKPFTTITYTYLQPLWYVEEVWQHGREEKR
jgi:hypothetical protein